MPKELKYGYLRGPRVIVDAVEISASQNFENDSGKWCKLATNRLTIADSGDTELFGWAEVGDFTSSATAGADSAAVDISLLSVFRMPADADPASTVYGDTCDLIVNAGNQQADVGESTEDVIQIVGRDADNDTVDVRLNPSKVAATGVV